MAVITNSEYGIVAVNNSVISKLIIDDMLAMDGEIIPCTRKGRLLRKGVFTGYNELFNAVELSETSEGMSVKVYYVLTDASGFQETSDALFDKVESDFSLLCLDRPFRLTASIKGILIGKKVTPKDIEMVRSNDSFV